MPRNRMVKSTFWVEENVVSCSYQARLLYIGMWNFCDDAGVHPAQYLNLKMEVFPGDSCSLTDVKKWINELITHQLIREYSVNNSVYWIVLGWKNRQTINRPTPSFYPLPESDLKQLESTKFSEDLMIPHTQDSESSVSPHGGLTPNIKEVKRKEVKEDICEVETSPIANSQQEEIFKYWQETLKHPRARIDSKRQRNIAKALKLYSVCELKQAIDGCSKTPFNMGENDRNQKYDDIELILRNASSIERFIQNSTNPPLAIEKKGNNKTDFGACY